MKDLRKSMSTEYPEWSRNILKIFSWNMFHLRVIKKKELIRCRCNSSVPKLGGLRKIFRLQDHAVDRRMAFPMVVKTKILKGRDRTDEDFYCSYATLGNLNRWQRETKFVSIKKIKQVIYTDTDLWDIQLYLEMKVSIFLNRQRR